MFEVTPVLTFEMVTFEVEFAHNRGQKVTLGTILAGFGPDNGKFKR